MTSYSQQQEDVKIVEIVSGISNGRFLDIGAWNPTILSNTRALYDLGWGGVAIEASPGPARSLIREYGNGGRVEVMLAAVGFSAGFARFDATDDAVSTSDGRVKDIWKDAGGYYGAYWIQTITLEAIVEKFGADWDFINIDTEGSSGGLFVRAMELGIKPKCICVEHDGEAVEIGRIAAQHGYRVALENCTNLVLAR